MGIRCILTNIPALYFCWFSFLFSSGYGNRLGSHFQITVLPQLPMRVPSRRMSIAGQMSRMLWSRTLKASCPQETLAELHSDSHGVQTKWRELPSLFSFGLHFVACSPNKANMLISHIGDSMYIMQVFYSLYVQVCLSSHSHWGVSSGSCGL